MRILCSFAAVETVLETREDLTEIPVTLKAELSEIGILEVFAKSVDRDTQYRLEFGLRDEPVSLPGQSENSAGVDRNNDPLNGAQRQQLEEAFRITYGKARGDVDPREIKRIRMKLEEITGQPRDGWNGALCRAVWDQLKPGMRRRRRSERHEATFFT